MLHNNIVTLSNRTTNLLADFRHKHGALPPLPPPLVLLQDPDGFVQWSLLFLGLFPFRLFVDGNLRVKGFPHLMNTVRIYGLEPGI